jgi:hypothetical protein
MTVGVYYWRVSTWDTYGVQGAWSAGRAIIVDRIKVNSLTADDTRRDIGTTVTISVQLVYEYDSGYITSGTFTLNGLTLSYSGSNGVWRATDSKNTVQAVTYNSVSGTEGTYSLTTVNMNSQSVTVIWDRIKTTWYGVSDGRCDVGSTQQVRVKLALEYDNTLLGSGDTVYINGTLASYDAANGWFYINYSLGTVGRRVFAVSSASQTSYGITTFTETQTLPSIIWDKVQFTLTVAKNRINVGDTAQISVSGKYAYDNSAFQGSYTLNDTLTKTTVGKWAFKISSMTDNAYGLTAFDSDVVEIIWDGLKISQYVVDLVNQKIYIKAEYAYDGQPIANGNVSYAGLYVLTNSTGWAVFNMSALPSVGWNSVAYPVSEPAYGLTYKAQNQTVAFHKLQIQPFTIRSNNYIGNPVWDDVNRKLTFTTSGTCIVKTGDWGQPLRVEVDGAVYTNWTYNSVSQEVSIFNLHSNVALIWQTQEGAVGGAPGGVSPAPAPAPTPSPPAEIPTIIPPTAPSLVNVGIVLIVAVVAGAFIYSQTGKAKTLDEAWRKRSKASAKTVSWKPSGKKSVSWKRKSRFRTLEE